MARILITGATGFIGRVVVQELLCGRHKLRALVRDADQIPPEVEPFVMADLRDIDERAHCLNGIDIVVHLAGKVQVSPEARAEDIEEMRALNVIGTAKLVAAARAHGVRRFVFLSTAKVCGLNTEGRSISEETPPHPDDLHGHTKLAAEREIWAAAGDNMEVVILRPPSVYGPKAGGNCGAILKMCNLPFPLPFGNIRNKKSMIYVGNLAHAIAWVAVHPAARNQVYVLRDGEDVSTRRLGRMLCHALGRMPWIMPMPLFVLRWVFNLWNRPELFARLTGSFVVDDRKIRNTLDWRPPFSLLDAIRATAQGYLARHPDHPTPPVAPTYSSGEEA